MIRACDAQDMGKLTLCDADSRPDWMVCLRLSNGRMYVLSIDAAGAQEETNGVAQASLVSCISVQPLATR